MTQGQQRLAPSGIRIWSLLAALSAAYTAAGLDTEYIGALVAPPFYVERHTVESEGYLLSVFRLRMRGAPPPIGRVPVLLHHGFTLSANVWFPLTRQQGLSYILYDAGYDVWALSDRGTTHSLRHTTLSPDQRAFWRFTMDDLALRDLPAVMSYVKLVTGQPKVAIVTWSMSGAQTFMLGSDRPDIGRDVCHHIALTPVVFPQRISTPLLRTLLTSGIDLLGSSMDLQLFMPDLLRQVLGPLCSTEPTSVTADLACDVTAIGAMGVPTFVTPREFQRLSGTIWPSPMAIGVPAQYSQLLHFDYGVVCGGLKAGAGDGFRCNREVYGTDDPPPYNLTHYDIPTTMIGGGRDKVSVPWDQQNVIMRLPPGVLRSYVVLPLHSHADFTWYDTRAYAGVVLQALRRTC